MDENSGNLPTLDLETLVASELESIQEMPMNQQKVVEAYQLFGKLDFVERLGVLPKEKVLNQKHRVMGVLENSIITEYTK